MGFRGLGFWGARLRPLQGFLGCILRGVGCLFTGFILFFSFFFWGGVGGLEDFGVQESCGCLGVLFRALYCLSFRLAAGVAFVSGFEGFGVSGWIQVSVTQGVWDDLVSWYFGVVSSTRFARVRFRV